jgi:V8-like Glu-specific endopeptidase
MMRKNVVLTLVAALTTSLAGAQVADTPSRAESHRWHSGSHDGVSGSTGVVRHVIRSSGATWLRVRFDNARLGSASDVTITSLRDGASQRLSAASLAQWGSRSAYLNGDAVEIRLSIRYPDRGVGIGISQVEAGQAPVGIESICGSADNRVASNDRAIGRLSNGCTAWLIPNGRLVTAGHCADNMSVVEFNVPLSTTGGLLQHPGPQDQYAVNTSSVVFSDGGEGNDYAVFTVFNNTTTGRTPLQTQGRSLSVTQAAPGSTIRITGFGTDTGSANQTQQTHTGPRVSTTSTLVTYAVDTTGGNSGSPILDVTTGLAVGVHTHGGCTATGGANRGTRTTVTAFWNALGITPAPPTTVTFGPLSMGEYCRAQVHPGSYIGLFQTTGFNCYAAGVQIILGRGDPIAACRQLANTPNIMGAKRSASDGLICELIP